ncbi:MAG: TetR/AcrR family transcriptional regulator [Prevotella sp.]|nr:TetR/AcrR family transcriptional regulator [Prevotella sp.]
MRTSVNPTEYRRELKGRILEVAMYEFKRNGIRSVKMDDIARLLSISKRTLYEIYSDKQSLLLEGICHEEKRREECLHAFTTRKENGALNVIMEFYRMQIKEFSNVNPVFFEDLKRYRTVMEYMRSRHVEQQKKAVVFFREGVKEGFFRSDVDYDIISRIGEDAIRFVMESRMYNEYSLEHIFRNIIFLFVRGFSTEKGIKLMDRLLEEGGGR